MDRRTFMTAAVGAGTGYPLGVGALERDGAPGTLGTPRVLAAREEGGPPRIAAMVTEYRENSHADVIVTKFLEGCRVLDVDFRPRVRIASLYLDQMPANDLGRSYAAKHGVPIFPTIEEALTLGGESLAVDGVLLIGEHGRYPYNELGQHMYPRRRFFEAAAGVLRRSGRAGTLRVPLFNDKHMGYAWADAKYMYDTARELKAPFMAGSSLPVTWRKPELEIPRGAGIEEALVVAHGGTESYGFHALETLQCMVERRKGGETGVRSVRWLRGDAAWDAAWSRDLLRAALSRSLRPAVAAASPDEARRRIPEPELFLVEYRDGLRGAVLMANRFAEEFLFAARLQGRAEPVSTLFWLQEGKPFGHFARLSMAIERMFLTGKPAYPVERTLLTTGVLDAVMHSRFHGGEQRATPELDVRYRV